jgi:O-antigen/teichoic acid export membrane protein
MSEPRRAPTVIAQTVTTFFGNSSGYVVAIITGIVVARTLGPAGKGVASYAALVMALFTAAGSGLQTAVMYQCGRKESQTLVYGAALRLLGLSMIPAALGLVAVAWLEPRYASMAYVACALPFAVYGQVACGLLLLHNDVRSTVIQGAIPTIGVGLLTIPALLVFHGGLTAVLAIWAGTFVASGCYAMLRLSRYLPPGTFRTTRVLLAEQGWFGLKSGSVTLAGFLNLRIDVFVVSLMLDARTLGVYTLAVATGELMWQVTRPLAWTTVGRMAGADRERAIVLTATVTRHILALSCVVGAAVFMLAPVAVRFVYGPAFAEAGETVRWLLPGVVLYAAQGPMANYVTIKEGKPLATLVIQVTSVAACAAISVLLIPMMNVFGAALATAVTYCGASFALAVLFARSTGTPVASFTLLQPEDFARIRRMLGRYAPQRRPHPEIVGVKS